ncbi:MAG: aldo/keto reductase [Deltaproteobacteria bacterium]|nr:aldo/keto reductase [Deltaproteobacteria bacterium]
MLYRQLGMTGVQVSAIGIGGSHIGKVAKREAIRIIRNGIDRGITFLDNSWDYNDGDSEKFMGKALRDGYREKAFLMTKIDGRTRAEAARQIDESLERLETDRVDLLQFHEIIRLEDPDRIFAEGGALEAVLEARQAGKLRFIGFTGHKDPLVHLRMLDIAERHGFRFDAVQMPINVMDAHFRSFEHEVLPRLVKAGIAPLAMKSMGSEVILKSGVVQPVECLRYALSRPVSVVITGIDSLPILEQALEVASTYRPLSDDETAELLARTRDAALSGKFELFKTTDHFDSTAQNPEWLGEAA